MFPCCVKGAAMADVARRPAAKNVVFMLIEFGWVFVWWWACKLSIGVVVGVSVIVSVSVSVSVVSVVRKENELIEKRGPHLYT